MSTIEEFVQEHQNTLTTGTVQAMAKDFGLDFDRLVGGVVS